MCAANWRYADDMSSQCIHSENTKLRQAYFDAGGTG